MKTSIIFDILFIFLSTSVVLPLLETGHADVISRYAVIFMLASYFAGKFVKGREARPENHTKGQ